MRLKKKIYFEPGKKGYYVIVLLFRNKAAMRIAKNRFDSRDGDDDILGCHCAYERLSFRDGTEHRSKEIGTIFFCMEGSGAGIVSHEFNHAVLWRWQMRDGKNQYPIMIMNMEEEEELLHMHTYAIRHFYDWYFRVNKKF